MVVDMYDDFCNNIDLEKCMPPYEAMCKLYALRENEFWEDAILALIRSLGVYPPSSIVELNDGSIGIVSTINLVDRLRPLIMMYSTDHPRNQAVLLDLAEETTLSIKQSLRPNQLPKEIWDYLNPRSMIRYFAYNTDSTASSANLQQQEATALSKV